MNRGGEKKKKRKKSETNLKLGEEGGNLLEGLAVQAGGYIDGRNHFLLQ